MTQTHCFAVDLFATATIAQPSPTMTTVTRAADQEIGDIRNKHRKPTDASQADTARLKEGVESSDIFHPTVIDPAMEIYRASIREFDEGFSARSLRLELQ